MENHMPQLTRSAMVTLAILALILLLGSQAEARGAAGKVRPKAKPPREVFLKLSGVT